MRAPIVVHIDALDLTAIPAPRRSAVAHAFVRELQALLAARPASWMPHLPEAAAPAPRLRLGLDAPPHRVGMALARSVYEGLGATPGHDGGGR